ncbi:MAG TPA: DUF2442 domain-containing protein [Prolixibacteraceae bacterium]|jgi:hypothetical protein
MKLKPVQVTNAIYIDGYKVEIWFSDKTFKTIDFGDFLEKHPHPQHNKYKDTELFKQFKIEGGNLVWGQNWDLIFPISQLHKGAIKD